MTVSLVPQIHAGFLPCGLATLGHATDGHFTHQVPRVRTMTDPADVASLPAFAAFEALPALAGVRPTASIQFDRTSLKAQAAMLAQVPFEWATERAAVVRATLDRFDELDVDVGSIDEETLMDASQTVRERFEDLPEAQALCEKFAGEVVVVPEWFRDGTAVHHGVRLILAPAGAAPDAEQLVRNSVRAATTGSRRRYQEVLGDLLGYPDCCVAFFADRGGQPPEWRSTASLRSLVNVDALQAAEHLEDVLPGFTDRPAAFAFFAREFYPEPGCDQAVSRGRQVHEVISEAAGEQVADDFLRLNYLYGLRLAMTVAKGGGGRPELGDLGPEHGYLYLPFRHLDVVERYQL